MAQDTPPSKPATIYDVAQRAGVSHITVSRVVNGKQNVSASTRERVQTAMRELHYAPNAIAQALQTRRSRTIELITTDIYGSDAAGVTSIMTVAHEHEFQFSLLLTPVKSLLGVLQTIPNRMVAGTILYAQDVILDYEAVRRVVKNHPMVQMGGKLQSGLPSVLYDQKLAIEQAIQHLIDLGHREIAFIGGLQYILDGQIRYQVYQDMMTRNGLKVGPIAFGNFASDSGAEAMRTILATREPFTAVIVSSDAMAIAAIYALRQAGRRVPEDVSIIGYNNYDMTPYLSPPLTTIFNDMSVLGRMTAEYLFELVESPDTPRHQRVLIADLIVRDSTHRR